MVRLPTPGGDSGDWGNILNTFLSVEHKSDGTQKTLDISKGGTGAATTSGALTNLGAVSNSDSRLSDNRTPIDGSVTNAKIASNAAIARAKLDTSTQNSLGLADTSVQQSSNDHINLLDYLPAGPDGNTDNSSIIRQAIIDAGNGPRRLFIPRQINPWIVGSSVLIDVDIEIFSDGWDTAGNPTIQLKSGLDDYGFKFDTTRSGGNHVIFRSIDIDGNCSQQTAGGIVAAYNPIQCLFDHVHFHHAYGIALWLRGQQGTGPFGHHNRIVNSLFDNSAASAGNGNAIVIQAADENMVSTTDFETNGNVSSAEPYHVKDWSGINAFVNCVFVGGGEGIRMQDISGSRVIGCMFDGVGRDALHISGSNIQVVGNHFSGLNTSSPNSYYHIVLDNGGYCSATGNVLDSGTINNALRGFVSNFGSSTHNMVTGNVFRVNAGSIGSGGVYDWNGGSATATSSIVKNNIGLADQ
jgi:hypothetical protein